MPLIYCITWNESHQLSAPRFSPAFNSNKNTHFPLHSTTAERLQRKGWLQDHQYLRWGYTGWDWSRRSGLQEGTRALEETHSGPDQCSGRIFTSPITTLRLCHAGG